MEETCPEILFVSMPTEALRAAASLLRQKGVHVRVAASVAAGLELAERFPPDVCMLAAETQEKAVAFCDAWQQHREAPVLLYSAALASADALAAGAADCVSPQEGPAVLAARVRPYLEAVSFRAAAAAAEQERNRFCYAASHDLKAPMQDIAQLGALLEKGGLSAADAAQAQELMTMRAQEAAGLVTRLLEVSRACSRTLVPAAVDLDALFCERVDALRAAEPQRRISIRQEKLPQVWMDPDMAAVLVREALSNAWKFTRPCTDACVQITASHTGAQWALCVADNGVGFDPAGEGRLFGLFERLHTAQQFEGTGAGLYLIRTIARRAGGDATLSLRPEGGAILTVQLPTLSM